MAALLCTQRSQNCQQGLGFTLGHRVINRKTLINIGVTLATSFTTLYATLMALAEAPSGGVGGGGGSEEMCELSSVQLAGIRIAMLGRNMSCAYNMSIATALLEGGE
jgi:hypothetical protein